MAGGVTRCQPENHCADDGGLYRGGAAAIGFFHRPGASGAPRPDVATAPDGQAKP